MSSKTGLHIRLTSHITDVIDKAHRLRVPFFQTFILYANHGTARAPHETHIKHFLHARANFGPLYLHASYWINCAHCAGSISTLLERELMLAQQLQFNFFVIHPGAVQAQKDRTTCLANIARNINTTLKKYPDITILLENVAHTHRALGGDIKELAYILRLIDIPERIGFCIDTAHAYAFGYNIAQPYEQDQFIALLEQELTPEKIKLIHLTDTHKECGSAIDAHVFPGAGNIGQTALQRFIRHHTLKDVPIILELPFTDESDEARALDEVNMWR